MKVKELIEKLQKFDPELEVVSGDLDDNYYNIGQLSIKKIDLGREVTGDVDPCICLVAC